MSNKRSRARALFIDDDEDKFYSLKILLPNSTSVTLTLKNPEGEMSMKNFVDLVKEEYDKTRKNFDLSGKKRKTVDWNLAAKSYLEFNGEKIKGTVRFDKFKPDFCNIIRLDDGSGQASIMYENMWDLTPDTDLLRELPQTYSFETALADLIDNSLQAVWSSSPGDRRLIRVDVLKDRITVFDSGPGMDSSSIDKWGKIGASVHRSQKSKAIGGKPPYLMPFFGMFGYGGPYACMHLGRHTLLSSKTKESKKLFTLQLNQEDLIDSRSVSGKNWKADGGMRDPSEEEIMLSPHGSFTKVEIFELKCKIPAIDQLQCILKDIYFPYIQCDEISKTGKTERPVEFQVNEVDLVEINGGKVATTNLNSEGHEFWFQIRFTVGEKCKGTFQEANARLKFVYFPIVKGQESINTILESLKDQGYNVSETFQTFSRVSVRRLGRLLPEVPWASIPFMQKGTIASTLLKGCQRVICFLDLDAGFNPTPSKTDLASQNPFTMALKYFGSKSKDNDVSIKIHRDEKDLSNEQVGEGYKDWVLEMHKTYDAEDASGEDEAIFIFDSLDNKALCISPECEAVRVHEVMKRKGKTWKRGQNIRILKGACAGVHKSDVYATIDYFIIEGFNDEAGGDARIICRQINYSEDEGCMISTNKGAPRLEMRSSSSYPISIIDTVKCLQLDLNEWNKRLEKQREKDPSKIDLLDESDCRSLNFDGESTLGDSVLAGQTPPQQVVAVVRPASFASSKLSKKLDQKHIVKMGEAMLMEVELQDTNMKSMDKNAKPLYRHRSFPKSRERFHGLYIFPLESKFPDLFKKAGTYNFCFSVGNSITCNKKVVVKPSSTVGSWKLAYNLESINVQVGSSFPPCSIACFDEYENQIPFTSVPSLEVELKASDGFQVIIDNDKIQASLIDGILKVENILIETDAILEIRSQDEPFSVSVACKVIPGPLKCVVEKSNPQALENLLPDSTVEIFILEMFDGYNNHVPEGANVQICIEGYSIQDSMGLNRKVDSCGCVDLSGILKVTAGYGKSVSLSVMSGDEVIFKKVSLVEKRELSLVTELPVSCAAGSSLTNLVFKVTEPGSGSMDTSIHHDEKSRCYHTMSIESDSSSVESAIRYDFIYGSCKVPSLSLPENEGVVSFRAYHSRHPELHTSFKIQLTQTFEREEIRYSTSLEREEIVRSTPSEREEIRCSTPFEREVVRSTPLEREEIWRSTPLEREEIVRSTPLERDMIVRSTPLEREEIWRSTPLEREEIWRSTPLEREEIWRSTPLKREEIWCSTPYSRMTLTPHSKMASNTNQSVAPTQETPFPQLGVLPIRKLLSAVGSQTGLMDMAEYTECLKERLDRYREQRVEVDERLKSLEAKQAQAEQELSTLQASLEPLGAEFPECLSTKEAMMKLIEEKRHDTAASVFCCLYRKAPPPQSLFLSKKGVFGIVALLGSVSSTSLSRVLSEYMGEDKMLALVCKSPQFGPNSVQYRRLQSEAAKLGRSITTNRLHVRCLESDDATSPWMGGLVENDPQRKLAMDDPKSPDGDPLPGFKGYAVNMIHLGSEELTIQTYSGHGLRETLFYDLFRNLQVYETQKHVEAARPFIDECKAVSLDGFIVKKNRYIYIGCSKPEICFPITVNENEEEKLRKLETARDGVRVLAKKIVEDKGLLLKLEKRLKKAEEKYDNVTTNLL